MGLDHSGTGKSPVPNTGKEAAVGQIRETPLDSYPVEGLIEALASLTCSQGEAFQESGIVHFWATSLCA